MMLALTDELMAMVMDLAAPLPPSRRSVFLQELTAELAKLPELGPGNVHRAGVEIQRRHMINPAIDGRSGARA
jgi:hypothetical protein